MPWARFDDCVCTHKKVVSRKELAKLTFYTSVIYCARELTDGRLTPSALLIVFAWAGPTCLQSMTAITEELLTAGLWERDGEDIIVHDYLDYNPTKEEVLEDRAARAAAGKLGGQKSAETRRKKYGTAQPKASAEAKPEASASTSAQASAQANAEAIFEAKSNPVPIPIPVPDSHTNAKRERAGRPSRFAPPSPEEAEAEFVHHGFGGRNLGEKFVTHYAQSGWKLKGGNKMADWKSAVQNWVIREREKPAQVTISSNGTHSNGKTLEDQYEEEREAIARLGI